MRPSQLGAVREIKDVFDYAARIRFLDVPIGSGKSLTNSLISKGMTGLLFHPHDVFANQYGANTQP